MEAQPKNDGTTCPECGAPQTAGLTCWEQLGQLLAWEAEDPALAAVHFLTVACYNLQHPAQFTDEAIRGLRAVFIDHLDHGVAVAEIRRRVGRAAAGPRRVLRDPSERRPVRRSWSMTIADVYIADRPDGAAERVRTWATCVRKDL
jgi:hypothetical protein